MTRGLWPLRQHSSAVYKPAGPAPTIKTDIPVRGCREILEVSSNLGDAVMSVKKLIVGRRVNCCKGKMPEIMVLRKGDLGSKSECLCSSVG